MQSVFVKLAEAYAGTHLKMSDIAKNAMLAFNGTFQDSLEVNINKKVKFEMAFAGNGSMNSRDSAIINKKLLLEDVDNSIIVKPGNIYEIQDGAKFIALTLDCFNKVNKNSCYFLNEFSKAKGVPLHSLIQKKSKALLRIHRKDFICFIQKKQ